MGDGEADRSRSLPFTKQEYDRRLSALERRMKGRGIETLLVVIPENVCYLTGYESIGYSSFLTLVVPVDSEPVLLLREMEIMAAETTTWLENFETYDDADDPVARLVKLLQDSGRSETRMAIEIDGGGFISPAAVLHLMECLGQVDNGSGLVEAGRRIKSKEEIQMIRRACRVTETGMRAALDAITPGRSENAVASAAYEAMLSAGSDFMTGDPIVTSGWRSGVAHFTFGDRCVEEGDTLLLELGGCRSRYFGPLMRSAAVAPVSAEVHRMAVTLIASLEAAIETIRPGVQSSMVDAACREVLEGAGYEAYFRKRTGYSVGLAYAPDWGEGHIVSLRCDDPTILEPGMVFHIPPALRVPRRYGLGFSETVLVTEEGCEVLTDHPRCLHVVERRG